MKPAPLLAFSNCSAFMRISLPAAFFPFGELRSLRAQRGVVAVTRVDDRRVAVDVEHPARHVAEKLREVAFLPRLADTAGEQAVAGEQVGGVVGSGQSERDRSWRGALEVNDVERQLADLDGVPVG